MKPTSYRTILMSIAILAFTLGDVMGWFPLPSMSGAWGCVAALPALVFLLLIGILWSRGVQGAGRGFHRWIFLTAFAAPIVYFGLSIADAPRDFQAGWKAGAADAGVPIGQGVDPKGQASQSRLAPPGESAAPSPRPWVAWITLTAVLTIVLNRLERRGAEADRQRQLAVDARSQVLAGRLAPHFIFNALNTLHAQIEADPKGAQFTAERLADLFRQVVEATSRSLIPLRQELAFVETYLGIEQARLGGRLRVTIAVPEELESTEIPPLSLQVLVENAIKHGVTPLEQGGEIRIGAERKDEVIRFWVEDPGPGISNQKGTGTALETLRQRLDGPEDLVMGMVDGRHRASFRWRQA